MAMAEKNKTRLAETVINAIRADILSGKLAKSAQLPTEPRLMEMFGVSRTVVREALAELRAAGMVRAIQGKGVFVADQLPNTLLSLSMDERRSIPRTIELLEFRTGVEVEAAGLAALRRTNAQEYDIMMKSRIMQQNINEEDSTYKADFDFHMAIAKASNNAFFVDTLSQFGPTAIPRANLPNLTESRTQSYLKSIQDAHELIATAISEQNPDAARTAMRAHLEKSQARYRALALAIDATPDTAESQ